MLVAALYDIHGNLPALEAVLEEVSVLGVDTIVVGGDLLPGPMPREVLARLLSVSLPVQFIYGNGEVAVLEQMAGRDLSSVPEYYRPIVRWTEQQLDSDSKRFIAVWPKTLRLRIAGLEEVLFCHATPRDENQLFTRLTPEDRILPFLEGLNVSVVVCGHTHMQFDRKVGEVRIVNAGSVGMPFGEPGADWLLLGPGIQLRHTYYDLAKAAETVQYTSYPEAQEFAQNSILQPPSEVKMLELFG